MDQNYLIGNAAGLRIFDSVKSLPVVDPHNHANVKEIRRQPMVSPEAPKNPKKHKNF
jgi:glucuronate isomerase